MKWKAQILTILCLTCVTLVFLSRPTAAEISSPGSDSKQESGEWSEVVDQIRGRLVADTILDAQGLDVVRIHLELQNLAVTPRSGKKFVFQGSQSFDWELTDAHGKSVPRWEDGIPGHVVDGGFLGFWISIPSESTLRFPVSKATYYVLQPSGALILSQDLLSPIWHLAADIRKQYFLKAKFKGLGGEKGPSYENWRGTLSLPPVRLPPDPKPHVNQGHL